MSYKLQVQVWDASMNKWKLLGSYSSKKVSFCVLAIMKVEKHNIAEMICEKLSCIRETLFQLMLKPNNCMMLKRSVECRW